MSTTPYTTQAWPDIHLEAVNRTAAFLLHKTGADAAPVEEYRHCIRTDMDTIDRAIASIHGQLQTRFDPAWAPGAMRALKQYRAQKRTLMKMMGAANQAMTLINSRIREDEKTRRMRETAAGVELTRKANAQARLKRIAAASNTDNRALILFRRKVAKLIGDEAACRLCDEAREEAMKENNL
jgi:hypothetical protein